MKNSKILVDSYIYNLFKFIYIYILIRKKFILIYVLFVKIMYKTYVYNVNHSKIEIIQ